MRLAPLSFSVLRGGEQAASRGRASVSRKGGGRESLRSGALCVRVRDTGDVVAGRGSSVRTAAAVRTCSSSRSPRGRHYQSR